MIFKIIYTILVLIVCIIIYFKIRKNEHSLGFIIVTAVITTIIGNLLIPSNISLFDTFERTKETISDTEIFSPSITLDSNSLNMISTDEFNLNVTTSPNDYNIKWSSDNEDVVTVDNNGHLKAINEGNTIITASIIYKDVEYKDTCSITVKNPIINLDSSYLLYIGENKKLSAITIPEKSNILWNSSNTDIIIVSDNGEIEAIAEGTATITATMVYNNKNYSADCIITVKAQSDENNDSSSSNEQNKDDIEYKNQETIDSEITSNNDLQTPETNSISIRDVAWLDDEKIYKDNYATTMRGEEWSDCIRFGSSNINSDGTSVLRVVCDQKYSKFTAEIAPQEGFDKTETVTFYIYGGTGDVQTFKEEYPIDYSTKPFIVEIDISNTDELYFWKSGNYNQGRIAGQYINGYTGMGVLMRDAVLYE